MVSIQKYDEAIEQFPSSPVPYIKRAYAYLEIKDPDQALEDCDKAIEMDSLNVEAHLCKAQAFLRAEKLTKALESAYHAIDLTSPNDTKMKAMMAFTEELRAELAKSEFVGTKGQSMEELKAQNSTFEAVQARLQGKPVEAEPVTPNMTLSPEQEELLQNAEPKAENMSELEKLQASLAMKMQSRGGEEFFTMMHEMSTLPAVKEIQNKVMKGQTPSMSEYWQLMKDERFRNFSLRMRGIEGVPELKDVLDQLKVGNWQKAFQILDNDDAKLDKFMVGFCQKKDAT